MLNKLGKASTGSGQSFGTKTWVCIRLESWLETWVNATRVGYVVIQGLIMYRAGPVSRDLGMFIKPNKNQLSAILENRANPINRDHGRS